MPGLSKTALISRLRAQLLESGVQLEREKLARAGGLPWHVRVNFGNGRLRDYGIYVWTIGHGGRTRSSHEYRIQAKLNDGNRLDVQGGTTLLLGLFDETIASVTRPDDSHPMPGMVVIVAWDPSRHLSVGASSSCQVRLELMEAGFTRGVAHKTRVLSDDLSETVIAMRPEYLSTYMWLAAGGHGHVTLTALQEHRRVYG